MQTASHIGINTFGLSVPLRRDLPGTLEELRTLGLTSVEPCLCFTGALSPAARRGVRAQRRGLTLLGNSDGIFCDDAARQAVDRFRAAGFAVEGAHLFGAELSPAVLEGMLEPAIAFALHNRLRYYVIFLNTASRKKLDAFLPAIRRAARELRARGIHLLYHNHAGEFAPCEEGTLLDRLFRAVPELGLELDLGWAAYAGQDCAALLRAYRDKIAVLHFKDMSGAGRRYHFVPVGQGILPLREILAQRETLTLEPEGLVLDLDRSPGDLLEDIAQSYRNLTAGKPFAPAPAPSVVSGALKLSFLSFPALPDLLLGRITLEWLYAELAARGIHRVDLMESELLFTGQRRIRKAMERHGISLGCLITFLSCTRMGDARIRRGLNRSLAIARAFGCRELMLVPMGALEQRRLARRTQTPAQREKLRACLYHNLALAAQLAQAQGVRLEVETTPTCKLPLSSCDDFVRLLQAVPGIGIIYDTANMIPGGSTPEEFYQRLRPAIVHAHIKDIRYVPRSDDQCLDGRCITGCPYGEGIIPVGRIISQLKADGFSGVAAIEFTRPAARTKAGYRRHLERFVRWFSAEKP